MLNVSAPSSQPKPSNESRSGLSVLVAFSGEVVAHQLDPVMHEAALRRELDNRNPHRYVEIVGAPHADRQDVVAATISEFVGLPHSGLRDGSRYPAKDGPDQ